MKLLTSYSAALLWHIFCIPLVCYCLGKENSCCGMLWCCSTITVWAVMGRGVTVDMLWKKENHSRHAVICSIITAGEMRLFFIRILGSSGGFGGVVLPGFWFWFWRFYRFLVLVLAVCSSTGFRFWFWRFAVLPVFGSGGFGWRARVSGGSWFWGALLGCVWG